MKKIIIMLLLTVSLIGICCNNRNVVDASDDCGSSWSYMYRTAVGHIPDCYISQYGDNDYFELNIYETEVIKIEVAANFGMVAKIFDEEMNQIAYNGYDSDGTFEFELSVVDDERYYIQLYAESFYYYGDYTLSVETVFSLDSKINNVPFGMETFNDPGMYISINEEGNVGYSYHVYYLQNRGSYYISYMEWEYHYDTPEIFLSYESVEPEMFIDIKVSTVYMYHVYGSILYDTIKEDNPYITFADRPKMKNVDLRMEIDSEEDTKYTDVFLSKSVDGFAYGEEEKDHQAMIKSTIGLIPKVGGYITYGWDLVEYLQEVEDTATNNELDYDRPFFTNINDAFDDDQGMIGAIRVKTGSDTYLMDDQEVNTEQNLLRLSGSLNPIGDISNDDNNGTDFYYDSEFDKYAQREMNYSFNFDIIHETAEWDYSEPDVTNIPEKTINISYSRSKRAPIDYEIDRVVPSYEMVSFKIDYTDYDNSVDLASSYAKISTYGEATRTVTGLNGPGIYKKVYGLTQGKTYNIKIVLVYNQLPSNDNDVVEDDKYLNAYSSFKTRKLSGC